MVEYGLLPLLSPEEKNPISTRAWQNKRNDLWTQWRLRSVLAILRSVWASAQSDQPLLSAWRRFGSLATQEVQSQRLGRYPDWYESLLDIQVNLLVLSCSEPFVIKSEWITKAYPVFFDRGFNFLLRRSWSVGPNFPKISHEREIVWTQCWACLNF